MFARPAAGLVRTIVIAAAVFAFAQSARAQQPSAAAIATAKEVITVKGANSLWEPLVVGIVERARQTFMQANPTLGKDLNEVAAKLRVEFITRSAEMLNDTAVQYATRFSEKELKDMLAFYKSPLGRKMLVEEPNILDQSMKKAEGWADKLSQEVIARMRNEMKKRGHEI